MAAEKHWVINKQAACLQNPRYILGMILDNILDNKIQIFELIVC